MDTIAAARLDDATVQELAADLRGRVLHPGDQGYDLARRHYNALIDKRPAALQRADR